MTYVISIEIGNFRGQARKFGIVLSFPIQVEETKSTKQNLFIPFHWPKSTQTDWPNIFFTKFSKQIFLLNNSML